MRCHRIQKRLAAYQDGEIAGEERELISAHLEGCPACRSAYAELEQAWQSLETIPEIQASAGFERRLFERIDARRNLLIDSLGEKEIDLPRTEAIRKEIAAFQDEVQKEVIAHIAESKKIMNPAQQKRFIELLRTSSNNRRVYSPFPKN